MKKIYLFLILSIQGLSLLAQSVTINLDEQDIADILTPEVQATVTHVTLSGHMSRADYAFVNDCPSLTTLDMTDVITDSIPAFCLAKAKSLADLYLPKKQTVFNFYAVKNTLTNSVTAHVTGLYPQLDVPTTGDKDAATDVYFTIEESNVRYFEAENGAIFSADMDTLYRYSQSYPVRSIYAKVICPYAFAWLRLPRGIEIDLNPVLELICLHAFEGIRWDGVVIDDGRVYRLYADLVLRVSNLSDPRMKALPRLEGPVWWNTDEYKEQNGSLAFYVIIGSLETYLEESCLWAGVDMIDEYYFHVIASTLYLNEEYYDKDGNRLTAVKPHFVSSEWHVRALSTNDVTFTSVSDGGVSMTTDMNVEYGAYYTFVLSYTTIERDNHDPFNPYFHTVEYCDTILSPIPDDDDLTCEIEIIDDKGNLVFSTRRKGGKGNTEHLSGVLTNVPQSQQGDLKSRVTARRYGESPWRSQRVNFNLSGIASPQLSPEWKGDWFDLTGRPVDGTQRGIYIRKGKKVLIK